MRGIGNGILYGKTRASWPGVPYWVPDSCYGIVYFEAILIKWWGANKGNLGRVNLRPGAAIYSASLSRKYGFRYNL